MPEIDPYKVLGVAKKASESEIKKAYRKLAREFHPDRNPGNTQAEERFKEVQEANSILSDPEKKKAYDSGGFAQAFGFGGAGGAPGGAGGFSGGFTDMFSDLFGGGGGGMRGRNRAQRGRDLETEVRIGFRQAVEGTQVSVSVPVVDSCGTCHGNGAAPGTSPKTCPRCGGRGVESQGQGMFSISQACSQCGGSGTIVEKPCPTCGGNGRVRKVKRYKVNIPPGVREGSRVRLAGKGEPGEHGGPAGDLYVVTHVAPSPVFKRKGDNFEVEVPVNVTEAILGATIEVPVLNGTKQIKVPPGTKHGQIIRLRGEGPPKLKGSGRGDVHFRISVEIPQELSKEQSEAVRDLASVMNGNPREALLGKAGVGGSS